jgi:hypothetical protein
MPNVSLNITTYDGLAASDNITLTVARRFNLHKCPPNLELSFDTRLGLRLACYIVVITVVPNRFFSSEVAFSL